MFITFEGIEGSGKSTQSKKLYEFLCSKNLQVILTREPGGSLAGEKIRAILLDEEIEKLDAKTELLLNFAARIEHVEKVIKPALSEGKIVICDRFFDSSFAYQGAAFGLDFAEIEQIKNFAIGDFAPQITFLIDAKVETTFARIAMRSDNNRYEKLGLDFHQKVRTGFLQLAQKNSRIKIINGENSVEEIFQLILKTLNYDQKK
jgi:dTMP kinase